MNQKLKKTINKFLITGTSSGLGKYLHQQLGGIPFKKDSADRKETEILIHCAFNRARVISSENLYQYISDNIFLTKRLTTIPHRKFIYISSVDVYPKDNKVHTEEENIDVNLVKGMYALCKLIAESIVKKSCSNFLVLRCSSLLGKDSKENSLIKIVKEENPTLTLSASSVFNYILHTDVLEFIKIAIEKDLQGIYNLASSENITLSEITELLGKKVSFGHYMYNVGNINNSKVCKLLPSLKKNSREAINEFTKLIV